MSFNIVDERGNEDVVPEDVVPENEDVVPEDVVPGGKGKDLVPKCKYLSFIPIITCNWYTINNSSCFVMLFYVSVITTTLWVN